MFGRQALHAWRLTVAHPVTGKLMRFVAPMASDFNYLLRQLRAERDNVRVLEEDEDDFDDDFDESGIEVIYVRD